MDDSWRNRGASEGREAQDASPEVTRRSFLARGAAAAAGLFALCACSTESSDPDDPDDPDVPVYSDDECASCGEDVHDVRDHGARGDGVHDDTVAVQATIDAAQHAGGGVVYFPTGVYRLQPQSPRTTDADDNIDEGHALSVTGSHITFRGEGVDKSHLVFHAFRGDTHEASWQIVSGKVFRGAGFFLDGGDSPTTAQTDITFEDLDIDGTAHCTHDNLFPADVITGDGWDLTHKGIWMRNDRSFDRIRVSRCHVHGWKGEVVYYGGIDLGRYTVEDCVLYDTNGDCNSVTASWLTVSRNTAHTSASAGFEDKLAEGRGAAVYTDNVMYSCDKEALSLGAAGKSGPWGPVTIARNTVSNCPRTGFLVYTSDTVIADNVFTDCAFTPENQVIYCRTTPGRPLRAVRIERNRIEAVSRAVQSGVVVEDVAAVGVQGLTIRDNWAGVTGRGVRNGATFTQAYGIEVADWTGTVFEGNQAVRTTYQYTDQTSTTDRFITGTEPVDIVRLRPPIPRDYRVQATYRVVARATVVDIEVSFFDGAGTRRSISMASGLKDIGHHTAVPVTVTASGSTEERYIRVTASAGAGRRVYVSAAISET
ncbi:right-handed parallel beta-helix repeat-containing protein [Geodermatophilus sp. SYSU D01186]